jgi:hypothetical protein
VVGGDHHPKHNAPGQDEGVRCVHVVYLLFSGVQLGPERAVAGGDHYTKHIAPGQDERGRCVQYT